MSQSQTPNCSYPKLFVVGCPRSGTSWVTQLIGSHPDVITVPGETHLYPLIYRPFIELPSWSLKRRLSSWKGILRRYGVKPLVMGFHPSDIWRGILRDYQILNRPNSHGLHQLVSQAQIKTLIATAQTQRGTTTQQAEYLIGATLDKFFSQNGKPNQALLEKTPLHIRYVDRILNYFPEARIIEVIRDGRDVCVSYKALAQKYAWARIGTAGAIRQWKQCINLGEKFRNQSNFVSRIHPVFYESLKSNPITCLEEIFDFAQLNWHPHQVEMIVRSSDISQIRDKGEGQYVRSGLVGEWKTRLSNAEIAVCQDIAGEELATYGDSKA